MQAAAQQDIEQSGGANLQAMLGDPAIQQQLQAALGGGGGM
jgi:hypothetical protein